MQNDIILVKSESRKGGYEMILSQTTSCVLKLGDEKAIELLAQAGFDAVDYSMTALSVENSVLNSEHWREYILKLRETAQKNNVFFNQGHAVGSVSHPDRDEALKILVSKNRRAIEIAAALGIKTLVIHPVESGDYIGREAEVFQRNMHYFNSLLPWAESFGVKLACENMWCGDKRKGVRTGSVCSNPFEHAKYIDEINNVFFVACLDVGHSALAGREAQDCIRVLGKRLGALHIHDNDYLDDMHTLPGLSEMNWAEITRALSEIGYNGDFTLETDHFFDSFETEEEFRLGLKLSERIGRRLIAEIEG